MRGLDPVLLTSPTVRSGTTLLQRLLCSSSKTLIYGEEVGKDLELQLQILSSRQLVYRSMGPHLADRLGSVLAGDGNQWLVDLMPDKDGYLAALRDGALSGLAYCREHAQSVSRPVWGFKYPGWTPPLMRMLFEQVPGTRVVYLVRDPGDTARSAKAWHGFQSEQDVEALCAQWLAHVQFMRQFAQSHAVLMLRYEALVSDPGESLARLAGFLDAGNMDPGLLTQRINSAGGNPAYLAPAELTPRETACVDATRAAAELD
ncbi:sulfotransferase family protein [Arenimonas alkanexedens]